MYLLQCDVRGHVRKGVSYSFIISSITSFNFIIADNLVQGLQKLPRKHHNLNVRVQVSNGYDSD